MRSTDADVPGLTRRRWLAATAGVGVGLAGCSGTPETDGESDDLSADLDAWVYVDEAGTIRLALYLSNVDDGGLLSGSDVAVEDVLDVDVASRDVSNIGWFDPDGFDSEAERRKVERRLVDADGIDVSEERAGELVGRVPVTGSGDGGSRGPEPDAYDLRLSAELAEPAERGDPHALGTPYRVPEIEYADGFTNAADEGSVTVRLRMADGVRYEFPSFTHRYAENAPGGAALDSRFVGDEYARSVDAPIPEPPRVSTDGALLPGFVHCHNPAFGALQSSTVARTRMLETVADVMRNHDDTNDVADGMVSDLEDIVALWQPLSAASAGAEAGTALGAFGTALLGSAQAARVVVPFGETFQVFVTMYEATRLIERFESENSAGAMEFAYAGMETEAFERVRKSDPNPDDTAALAETSYRAIVPGAAASPDGNAVRDAVEQYAAVQDAVGSYFGVDAGGDRNPDDLFLDRYDGSDLLRWLEDVHERAGELQASEQRVVEGLLGGGDANAGGGDPEPTETIDWPTYKYDPANTGSPGTWGPDDPVEEAWRFETDHDVRTSPTVVGDTVYVAAGGGYEGTVYALSTEDGSRQWEYETGGVEASTPAVHDDTLYVGGRAIKDDDGGYGTNEFDGCLYALSTADGSERWTFETGNSDIIDSSPVVYDGTVFVGSSDDYVYALDADTGEEEWTFRTGSGVTSSPAVVDGTLYVGSLDDRVYALSTADGTERWAFETSDFVESSPAVVDGTVYVGNQDQLYALSADDGSERWTYTAGTAGIHTPVTTAPAVEDGTVYVGSGGTIAALSAADGSETWTEFTGNPITGSPVVVDGTVYLSNGSLHAVSAETGDPTWEFEGETGAIYGSPAVVDGTLYVGHTDYVYALS